MSMIRGRRSSIIRGRKGSMLVEVMIAGMIGLGIVLAVTNSTMQNQKQLKKMTLGSDWTNAINLIRLAMSDSTNCANILGAGGATQFADSTGTVTLTELGIWTVGSPGHIDPMFQTGVTLNNFNTKKIELVKDPNIKSYPSTANGVTSNVETRYINIAATRVTGPTAADGNADLYSGMINGAPTPDMIELIINKDPSTNNVQSCSVVVSGGTTNNSSTFNGPVTINYPGGNVPHGCHTLTSAGPTGPGVKSFLNNNNYDIYCGEHEIAVSGGAYCGELESPGSARGWSYRQLVLSVGVKKGSVVYPDTPSQPTNCPAYSPGNDGWFAVCADPTINNFGVDSQHNSPKQVHVTCCQM